MTTILDDSQRKKPKRVRTKHKEAVREQNKAKEQKAGGIPSLGELDANTIQDYGDTKAVELAEELKNRSGAKNVLAKADTQLKDLVDKILLYCETQADTKLHEYQQVFGWRIIECLVTNSGDELTALFSRQSGKTETLGVVIPGCMVLLPILAKMLPDMYALSMYAKGFWVGIFAPSNEQAYTAFTRVREKIRNNNAKMVMNDPEIDTDFENEKGNPMVLTNGSLCRMQSAAKQSQIESKSYHMVLIDECQDVDNTKIKKSIHPMLAAYNGLIIKIGTSNTKKSDFYDAIRRNIRQEQHYGAKQNHFQYDYKTVQKYNPKYKAYIEKEIERLGYDSDEFRMAYRLHFILERGMFMTQEEFEETFLSPSLKHKTEEMMLPCAVGIDVAKSSDSTVVTVLAVDWSNMYKNEQTGEEIPHKYILNWLELQGEGHEEQFWQIVDFLKNYNVQTIFVDSTGMGDPVADRFAAYYSGQAHVEGYQFTRPSKSVMWKSLYQEITGGRLKAPGHPRAQRLRPWMKFRSQMLDLEKDYIGQFMVCQHPDIKGAHDDFCDSLGLANLAAMSNYMPEVREEHNPFYPTSRASTEERLFGRWRR
jgi:hypothetical protein